MWAPAGFPTRRPDAGPAANPSTRIPIWLSSLESAATHPISHNESTPVTAELPILDDLIRHARHRAIWQLALGRSLWAVTAALVAEALLLIFGTGVVAWYVPLIVFALAMAVAFWSLRGHLPREYATAQALDSALHTSDLLSSAWHVSTSPTRSQFAPLLFEQAEASARSADPGAALPWRWMRSSRWMAGTALATLALFGLRYGVLHSLDLSASVVSVIFDTFTGQSVADAKKTARPNAKLPQPTQIGLNAQGDAIENTPPEEVLKNYEVAGQANSGSPSNIASPNQQDQRESSEVSSPEEQGSNVNLPEGAQGQSTGANQQKSSDVKSPPRPDARQQKKDSGLLDKMRDALASMMDKLKLNSNAAESMQSAAAQEAQSKNAQRQSEKGSPSPGKPQQGDPQSQQSQEQADSSQSGQKSQSDSPSQNASDQQHSGIGKQDGSKNTEMAKDAEALGKLSELVGKRSMNLQGEMMVEVENTRNPQLRTPYLNRSATHGEAGGDLSRDEVPLRHQEFVRRYYEQVRRQPDSLVPTPHKAEAKP